MLGELFTAAGEYVAARNSANAAGYSTDQVQAPMYSWSSGPQSTGGKSFGEFMSQFGGINTGTQGLDWKMVAMLVGGAALVLMVLRRK